MTERLHIGTHKGLFELARHNGVWDIADVQFLGDPVSAVVADTEEFSPVLSSVICVFS
jgi:hypothetical protein